MFEKLIKKIAAALKAKNIPYMIIGGQAVLLYGEPRLTRDIDITLGVGTEYLSQIIKITNKLNLHPLPTDPQKFVKKTWVLPCEDKKTSLRVDFIFSFTPYERQAIERSRKVKIENQKVAFASVEDVIIHKIFAGRPRDLEDIVSILRKNPKVNSIYIQKWLKEFDKVSPEKSMLKTFKDCLKLV
ncbi:MAG: nucleotidyl transferase AbiEii/AbiGii toxin family protein [Candidatus Margulisiibacteriota bacterium]